MKVIPFSSLLSRRRSFAALLIVAVLWAQWLGLEHAVLHAFGTGHSPTQSAPGLLASAVVMDVDSGLNRIFGDTGQEDQDSFPLHPSSHPSAHHSCAAFDTATLGTSAPATLLVSPVCPFTHNRAEIQIPEFYLPLFAALFNSRAPPSSQPA